MCFLSLKLVAIMTASKRATTSLQQALVSSSAPPSTSQKAGGFESCFAQGLDLSEFAAPSSSTATTVSHSAALLQIKQSEAEQQQIEEQEEIRLQQLVRERVLAAHSKKEDDHGLVGALIGMHRTDPCVTERRHHRSNKKRIIQREKPKQPSKKVPVVKKTQRRKH